MITFDQYKQLETPLDYTKTSQLDRLNIGLVLLSTEYSLEMEWSKLLGNQALIHSSRVYFSGNLEPTELQQISSGISDAAALIAQGISMDVMAFACTSASMVIGERQIAKLLTKNRGNIPATNPWTAAKAAFNHLGAKKIAVVSPYLTQVNYYLYQQLLNAGFDITWLGAMGIDNDKDITLISKASLQKAIEQALSLTKPDLVFMSCTNLRAIDYIEEFEKRFEIPIVTSNSALFWHVLNLAGKKAKCPGYGMLLNAK
jgi:maleate isomerase